MADLLRNIEILATVLSLLYLILMIREQIWCWAFGIVSSLLSVYLFYKFKLYAESILYCFYAVFAIYGWWTWKHPHHDSLQISVWKQSWHLRIVLVGVLCAGLIGFIFQQYTDAEKPFIDAHTSVFGLIATYFEAHKILGGWIYWIVINAVTIWLYALRGLTYYSWLMVLYLVLSFVGYIQWRKQYLAQKVIL